MAPKGASTAKTAMRLPPLPRLKVRHPNQKAGDECGAIMTTVLSCWASAGYTSAGCLQLEETLRACMDKPRPVNPPKNTINYHLSRMYPRIMGPRKKK